MSTSTIFFWLVLLVDWLSYTILLFIGVAAACLICYFSSHTLIENPKFMGYLSQYLGAFVVVSLFAHNKEKIVSEKLKTLTAIGASIAHELRTPLRTILSSTSGLKKHIPKLIDSYQIATHESLDIPFIDPDQQQGLTTACESIENEVKFAFTFIDMLLIKASQTAITTSDQQHSMVHCISNALERYPFDLGERELITVDSQTDFIVTGDEVLITHLFFNLIKNALYYIRVARKGSITITLESTADQHILFFKDTGQGIHPKVLPYIFERFFSRTQHGTGLGLYFCKLVMESMQGQIKCVSKFGEYTEFQLFFPNASAGQKSKSLK